MIVFVLLLFGISIINSQQFREEILRDWVFSIVALSAVLVAFSPFFILWRIEVPICFNRKTRKVSFWMKGQLAQVDWDDIEAYTKLARSVAAGSGAPVKEQIVAFNIFTQTSEHYDPEAHNVTISGTDYWDKDDPVAGAKGLWEYAYLFMEKGKQALPEDKIELKGYSLMETLRVNNPLPHKGLDWIGVVIHTVLLPITIPLFFITVPTDVIYTFLDKILPRRNPPKPLREACEAE